MNIEYNSNGEMLQGLVETPDLKRWFKDGLLHRNNGPARITYSDGNVISLQWYKNGKLHRDEGPAQIYLTKKFKAWYRDDRLVKIETCGHTEHYNLLGQLHRTDGPAIIKANGDKEWYYYGKLHRDGGPAVERADGFKGWFTHGVMDEECGLNTVTCKYNEKVDINRVREIFMNDINQLIVKYDSDPQYRLISSFLRKNLQWFDELIYNRDELLTYEQQTTLVDYNRICSKKCTIDEKYDD